MVCALVVLAACRTTGSTDDVPPSEAIETPARPASAIRARVVHVTDGDTIVLDGIGYGEIHRRTGGRKSRLIGIDTPETARGPECFGRLASEFTERELGGETVFIDFDIGKTDRYGRALVYIWEADGAFFNARLVAEGFAQQLTVPPNVRYAQLFTELVREARESNRGLWGDC